MIETLATISSGALLGLSLAAPPGPVNAVIAFEGAKRPLKGTLVGLGAMTSDFIYMLAVLYLGTLIPEWAKRYFFLIGGFVMAILAWMIWRSEGRTEGGGGHYAPYLKGLTMGLTNPYQMGWWVTAGLSSISLFGPAFIVGFFLGISLWITVFPMAMNKGAYFGGERFIYAVKVFSVLILLGFATFFILEFFT